MIDGTAMKLAEEFHPLVTYSQSDEISLVFFAPEERSQLPFDGKMVKLTSVLASAATMYFNMNPDISFLGPQQFDCRFFSVPDLSEATNYILWRMRDCSRNSILSVAQYYLSHKKMQGKKCSELLDILFAEKQVIWGYDFSIREQRGSLILPIKRKCNNVYGEYERNDMVFIKPTPNLEELSHAERIATLFPEV